MKAIKATRKVDKNYTLVREVEPPEGYSIMAASDDAVISADSRIYAIKEAPLHSDDIKLSNGAWVSGFNSGDGYVRDEYGNRYYEVVEWDAANESGTVLGYTPDYKFVS